MEEGTYVPHHPKKIVFLLSAMRHFAQTLTELGFKVDYIQLDSELSLNGFSETLAAYLSRNQFDRIVITEPGEYRVLSMLKSWQKQFSIEVEIRVDNRFICSVDEFASWAEGKKQLLMEHFYRQLRKKTGLLMEDAKPVGGKWNYDHQNRKPPKNGLPYIPQIEFEPDKITLDVIQLVKQRFPKHFGDIEPFHYAVTRTQAGEVFKNFINNMLPLFGDYQDAMLQQEYFLYHSVISHYINAGLLDAYNVCKAAEQAYQKGRVPINAAEGFIRQILGWREYVRGIYWLHMPDYAEHNFLNYRNRLPDLYWGADTKLNCLKQVVKQTKESAYSHHIQRLMVTGNFAMLIGVEPKQIHEWYLAVYMDAFEWVEMPNTIGMATFADGGIVGTKPYASSGAYINRMSDFCQNCHYDVKQKQGEDACPFNYLYWNFLIEHQDKLATNHRLTFAYKNLQRFSDEQIEQIQKDSKKFISSIC